MLKQSNKQAFDFHITQGKYQQLQKDLEKAVASRPALASEMQLFASDGDFSENAAYQAAKRQLRSLNRRIDRLKSILKNAEIIPENTNTQTVDLGHYVTLKINSLVHTYQILGSMQTAPSKNIISHNSPIGSAIMGHQVGDVLKVKLNDRVLECEILSINSSQKSLI